MTEGKTIVLDPITQKEILTSAEKNFLAVMEEFADTDLYSDDALREIVRNFYYNGYLHGAIDATESEELRDTIALMNEEIEYQHKSKVL